MKTSAKSSFKPDRVVGPLLIFIGADSLLFGLFMFGVSAPPVAPIQPGVSMAKFHAAQQLYTKFTSHIFGFPSPFHDGRTVIVMALIECCLGALLILTGIGVRLGARKAMLLSLVTSVVGFYPDGYQFTVLLAAYAIVRLTGRYGPMPETNWSFSKLLPKGKKQT